MNADIEVLPVVPRGFSPVPHDLDSLLRSWIADQEIGEESIRAYVAGVRQFLDWMGRNGITAPERKDIVAFRNQLRAERKEATTIRLRLVALRNFFRWLSDRGYYRNIADHIKSSRLNRDYKRDPLTAEQVRSVLAAVDREGIRGIRDYALIALMVTTGIRSIEAVRADTDDLRVMPGAGRVLFVHGKGHDSKDDFVKVPAVVAEAIDVYLKLRFAGCQAEGGVPLFASLNHASVGARLTTRSVRRQVTAVYTRAGITSSRITTHSLRHTAATEALLSGATLEDTKTMLRHKDINTTLIYSHHIEKAKNPCADRNAQAFFGTDGSVAPADT